MRAEAILARDKVTSGALFGTALATGMTVAEAEAWPERIAAVDAAVHSGPRNRCLTRAAQPPRPWRQKRQINDHFPLRRLGRAAGLLTLLAVSGPAQAIDITAVTSPAASKPGWWRITAIR